MPTYNDPLGKYDHLKPVPLEQAAKEVQIAQSKYEHLRTAIQLHNKESDRLKSLLSEAEEMRHEKNYLLYLSAIEVFIPPAI